MHEDRFHATTQRPDENQTIKLSSQLEGFQTKSFKTYKRCVVAALREAKGSHIIPETYSVSRGSDPMNFGSLRIKPNLKFKSDVIRPYPDSIRVLKALRPVSRDDATTQRNQKIKSFSVSFSVANGR